MKKNEIVVGGVYIAKVSNKLTKVRVDSITDNEGRSYGGVLGNRVMYKATTSYGVTNLTTGRKTSFRSATKFRKAVSV